MPRNLSDGERSAFRARAAAVAERLLATRGPDAVTMRELARALGVSAMTPYRYFQDKDEILAVARAAALDRLAAALEAAMAVPGNTAERADRMARAYLDFALGAPAACRLTLDPAPPDDRRFPDLARAAGRVRRAMADYMRGQVDAGILDGDPDLLGRVFWATAHGLVALHLAGALAPEPDLATLYRAAMRLLARGARVAPAGRLGSRPA
jgi:AcrR family transcriptional regulator